MHNKHATPPLIWAKNLQLLAIVNIITTFLSNWKLNNMINKILGSDGINNRQ